MIVATVLKVKRSPNASQVDRITLRHKTNRQVRLREASPQGEGIRVLESCCLSRAIPDEVHKLILLVPI
jgi:hypothetical protein